MTRRLLGRGGVLVLALFGCELLAQLAGHVGPAALSLRRARASQAHLIAGNSGAESGDPLPRNTFEVPHPYVGVVLQPGPGREAAPGFPISADGFIVIDAPAPGDFVVGVFGGSVAAWMGMQARDALVGAIPPELVGGRRIAVRLYALGGYKQPQQLMELAYALTRGDRLDAVVEVDGFNEVALVLANFQRGVFPLYPRSWVGLVAPLGSAPERLLGGELRYVRELRLRRAASFGRSPWGRSALVTFVWCLLDRGLVHQETVARAELEQATMAAGGFAGRGPHQLLGSEQVAIRAGVDVWQRSSLQMARLCQANGLAFVQVLQPNQYDTGSKPMAAAERAEVILPKHPYRSAVEIGYPLLSHAGEELRRAGVHFVDLRRLFAAVEEQRYDDTCCHLNTAGYGELARRVGQELAVELRARPLVLGVPASAP
jgi:hypothetical protein